MREQSHFCQRYVIPHPRTNDYDGEREFWVKTRVSGKREAEATEEIIRREVEDDQDI